jgi:hypothetical protein
MYVRGGLEVSGYVIATGTRDWNTSSIQSIVLLQITTDTFHFENPEPAGTTKCAPDPCLQNHQI